MSFDLPDPRVELVEKNLELARHIIEERKKRVQEDLARPESEIPGMNIEEYYQVAAAGLQFFIEAKEIVPLIIRSFEIQIAIDSDIVDSFLGYYEEHRLFFKETPYWYIERNKERLHKLIERLVLGMKSEI